MLFRVKTTNPFEITGALVLKLKSIIPRRKYTFLLCAPKVSEYKLVNADFTEALVDEIGNKLYDLVMFSKSDLKTVRIAVGILLE